LARSAQASRIARFGLIERCPNAHWVLKGFTEGFAMELFKIREMFEQRSAVAFTRLPPQSPLWRRLRLIRTAPGRAPKQH
jgi:DNA-binding GntR family transcriptional regulator